MTGKYQAVKIGPWPGGLNNRDTPENVADNELAEATNVIFDDDGTVYSRPPVQLVSNVGFLTPIGCIDSGSHTLGSRFLMYESSSATIKYVDLEPGYVNSFTNPTISTGYAGATTGSAALSTCEYLGTIYYGYQTAGGCRGATNLTGALTNVNTIPGRSDQMFLIRERMWSIDYSTSICYWSKETDPTIWAAPDGGNFPVNASDSNPILKVIVLNNNMWIFKKSGVWLFTYSDDPAFDGQLQKIVDHHISSATEHNGIMYVFDGVKVNQFINGQFVSLSERLLFNFKQTGNTTFIQEAYIYCVDKYLILTMAEGTQALAYVMNTRNGAWSKWEPANPSATSGRDIWPCSHGVKDLTGRSIMMVGGFAQFWKLTAFDFTTILGDYSSPGVINGASWGPIDGCTSNNGNGGIGAAIKVTTKRFGLGDYGRIKKFHYVRSLTEIDTTATGGDSHTFAWNAILDKYQVLDNSQSALLSTANLLPKPSVVKFTNSNVRFREVQFSLVTTSVVSSSTIGRTMLILEGLIFYFLTSQNTRLT